MHNSYRCSIALWLVLAGAAACNQERNRSIELMNHGVEMGRQKLFERARISSVPLAQ